MLCEAENWVDEKKGNKNDMVGRRCLGVFTRERMTNRIRRRIRVDNGAVNFLETIDISSDKSIVNGPHLG